jgi:hypothetical protein
MNFHACCLPCVGVHTPSEVGSKGVLVSASVSGRAVSLHQGFEPLHLILTSGDGESYDSAPRDSNYRHDSHHLSFTSLRSSGGVDPRVLKPILKEEEFSFLGSLAIKVGLEVPCVYAAVTALASDGRVEVGSLGHREIVAGTGVGSLYARCRLREHVPFGPSGPEGLSGHRGVGKKELAFERRGRNCVSFRCVTAKGASTSTSSGTWSTSGDRWGAALTGYADVVVTPGDAERTGEAPYALARVGVHLGRLRRRPHVSFFV